MTTSLSGSIEPSELILASVYMQGEFVKRLDCTVYHVEQIVKYEVWADYLVYEGSDFHQALAVYDEV
jgi:hypothetical protein